MYWGIRRVTGGWLLRVLAHYSLSLSPFQRTLWVRALYDFDAMEHDELGFRSGDILEVLDSSNPSWWKGRLRGELGLFPANYVTPVHLWGRSMPKEAHVGAAFLMWQGERGECIFPCPQDIWWFWFCLNLLATDLLKCWYEREPFEEERNFSLIFHIHDGEGAKILDCSLRPCWILPVLSLLWLSIDNFLQLGLLCRNAPQTSQASVFRSPCPFPWDLVAPIVSLGSISPFFQRQEEHPGELNDLW